MKTTLEIPEEIYRELKVRAAREGTTMTKIISSALEAALERPVRAAPGSGGRPSKKKRKEKKIAKRKRR